MQIIEHHVWQVTPAEARLLQEKLHFLVDDKAGLRWDNIRTIAAADVSFSRFSPVLFAGVVLLGFPDLQLKEIYRDEFKAEFPYIPGYLSFREAPAVLSLFRQLPRPPDVLLCDGHGFAHPRRFGLASHLGLFLNIPTIGCAKSVLVGECKEPEQQKGSVSPLIDKGEQIGLTLRTRSGVKPVYISVGHRINLSQAADIVLACSPKYRIPEPIRQAHREVNLLRRQTSEKSPTEK
ncbi:MAG: deoxyribonuclease V [Calditrichia bacterium]